jgi:outer membrane protein assembly factor BamB
VRTLSVPTLIALVLFSTSLAADDWPQWRGSLRDGISRETGLLREWPAEGPPLTWKTGGLGSGYSTVTVANGRIFTLGAESDAEYVIALDVTTGKELWRALNGRRYRDGRGDGPRGATTVDGNRVYALGGSGDLSVLDVATGKRMWWMNVLDAFGGRNITWGIAESPLILEDRVLVNAGGRDGSIVALDKNDGSILWKSEVSDEASYSSAVVATLGGVRQAIYFTGERALGVSVDDGSLLWHYRRVSNRTANVATPIVRGNYVFLSSDYGTGCALLEIQGGPSAMSAREVYFNQEMKNHHASSVLVDDTLYGFSSSILTALDFETGAVMWKDRGVGKGSLIYADGHLYTLSENGVMGLVEATRAGYREKSRFEIPRSDEKSWSHPVISDGQLYLRDQDTLYSFSIRR